MRRIRLGSASGSSGFPFRQARHELLDDLLVGRAERTGLGRCDLRPVFNVPNDVEEDLECTEIGCGGAVDELCDYRLALGDLPMPAVLSDDDGLVECLIEQG